jgi:hypothetical protein
MQGNLALFLNFHQFAASLAREDGFIRAARQPGDVLEIVPCRPNSRYMSAWSERSVAEYDEP